MKIANVERANEEAIMKVVASEGTKSGKMVKLFEMGLEIKAIAELMGTRYNFVYNVVQNHTIKNDIEVDKTQKESKKDEIVALANAGKTKIEIAKALKCDYNYVWQTLSKRG